MFGPGKILTQEEVYKQGYSDGVKAEKERASKLVAESQKVIEWFERMREDHTQKLSKSFEEAVKNWDELLQEPINLEPLMEALAEYQKTE